MGISPWLSECGTELLQIAQGSLKTGALLPHEFPNSLPPP